MKVVKDERGFRVVGFGDRDRTWCEIQESSLATEPCLRLGTTDNYGQMHLTIPMVSELLPLLQHFVETGELPEVESDNDGSSS